MMLSMIASDRSPSDINGAIMLGPHLPGIAAIDGIDSPWGARRTRDFR
jgi:hypothetical protein